jgi:hypothetical protein
MAYTTVFENIVFIEGSNPMAKIIKDIKIDLGGSFGAQLKNLTDVKRAIVVQVKSLGGNCFVDFKYGQKSRWLAIDDVSFYGTGKAAILPAETYNEIMSKKG